MSISLLDRIKVKFDQALLAGDLIFREDTIQHEIIIERNSDIPYTFQLTRLESLASRPETGSVSNNPFARPEPELTIASAYGKDKNFRLVLNKFPVQKYHFMLITKNFESQNSPLSSQQLQSVYEILQILGVSDKENEWFAFYNCGPQSGASQPHKHIQFMTHPAGANLLGSQILRKATHPSGNKNELLQDPMVPFAHFIRTFSSETAENSDSLAMSFATLLERASDVLSKNFCHQISYNLCMTTGHMMIIPRTSKQYEDLIGINSCGYMGMVLCKNSQIFEGVMKVGIIKILTALGCPNINIEQLDEDKR